MILLLSVSMLTLTFNIQPVKATIYITSDYTFPGNICEPIVVLADNIVIDGNGHTLQGTGGEIGIVLNQKSNVTVKNVIITQWQSGISLFGGSNNTISGNTITDASLYGVRLYISSNNNTVSDNTITNCDIGVLLTTGSFNNIVTGNTIKWNKYGVYVALSSNNNTVSKNTITSNWNIGLHLFYSSNNSIIENTIGDNTIDGVFLYSSSDNKFYHNNFIDNLYQARVDPTSIGNIWDDGYPSGGNYWSDYTSRYPNAQELDNSGIWDTPYVTIGLNQDNYPLIGPWTFPEVPPADDTDAYIGYVNETIQDLPDEKFIRSEEDVSDLKNDFSDLWNDIRENINEGNYEIAIGKLNWIKGRIYQEIVASVEREKIIFLINDLISYLETLL